jgi:pimeloyl-ACP methyl ester carboxylesterase
VPVLIVQGDNDLQVTVVDAKNLSQAQPSAQLKIFPGMNHVLKETPKDNLIANFAAYGDAEMPLAAGLSDEIAGFIAGRR